MPAHPFARFDPLGADVFADLLNDLQVTFLVLAAVVIGTAASRWRGRGRTPLRRRLERRLEARRRRAAPGADSASGWWALPLLCWALQATDRVSGVWFGLGHPTRGLVLYFLFELFLGLTLLIVAQSLAVAFLSRPGARLGGPRLGVGGGLRAGVRYAIAAVLVDGLLVARAFPPYSWH